jgi:hypothetical protein
MEFPSSYSNSRQLFLKLIEAFEAELWHFPCPDRGPDEEDLFIDVARIGSPKAQTLLVLSTGLHGVEGPVGLPMLRLACEDYAQQSPESTALLLIHALNPFGFAWWRRQDHDGVDLNRNFLLPDEDYAGAAASYRDLEGILNPKSPPKRDGFAGRALLRAMKMGLGPLKQAIVEGQYDFPRGLFYGGGQRSWTQSILSQHWLSWMGGADKILHLDVHSGLGPWGRLQLLGSPPKNTEDRARLLDCFPSHSKDFDRRRPVHYHARGELGRWCQYQTSEVDYRYFCAEFGTYGPFKTLGALRQELRNWEWGDPNARHGSPQNVELKEIFCPQNTRWRQGVIEQSRQVLDGSWKYLSTPCP